MGGIAGAAFLRAADAMLQTLGADSVTLLLPATATAGDAAGMIGLVDPGVQTVEISPVVVREIETGNLGPRRRIEFTMPASVIAAALPSLGIGTAEELFDAVLGLNYANDLFHVETFVPESFAGTVCFYVVTAVE
jgi:hypothetical protein